MIHKIDYITICYHFQIDYSPIDSRESIDKGPEVLSTTWSEKTEFCVVAAANVEYLK